MSTQPTLVETRKDTLEWILVNLVLYGLFILIFGPITALVAVLLRQKTWPLQIFLPLTFISTSFFLLGLLFIISSELLRPAYYWGLTLLLFPLSITLFNALNRLSGLLKPLSLDEMLKAEEQRILTHDLRLSTIAKKRNEPYLQPGSLRIGAYIDGDDFPDYTGIKLADGWLTMAEPVLDQHLFILGATGVGKTETIKRLIHEILISTNRNVYFVDGKDDENLATDIFELVSEYRRERPPVFRLGLDDIGDKYNAFQGQAADIYNRLCVLAGVTEARGDATYYADINRDILQLICYAPDGPPRTFTQVRTRLNRRWLENAFIDNEVELQTIDEEITDNDLRGLARRIRPLAREFSSFVGKDGFALETTNCAIFTMRTQSVGDSAKRFIDFLVEDLKDFVGKRQIHPSVLIIDEFGQFGNRNITSLLSLARSSNMSVILATQDVASLTDETTKKLILANTRTKILMATEYPEDVAQLAGTAYQLESSIQHEEGETTGLGSTRVQHAFKVDMNEVARLKAGQAFFIRQRNAAKIQVRQVERISNKFSQA